MVTKKSKTPPPSRVKDREQEQHLEQAIPVYTIEDVRRETNLRLEDSMRKLREENGEFAQKFSRTLDMEKKKHGFKSSPSSDLLAAKSPSLGDNLDSRASLEEMRVLLTQNLNETTQHLSNSSPLIVQNHSSVIKGVLSSEPIKEFIAAKESFAHKEGTSPLQSVAAAIQSDFHSDFPPLQEVRALNRPQQADLAITSPPSPCSPQVSNFTAVGSFSSQSSMELMHLSPPLMEKLEADLVLLQKKYGLVSQALTPARRPHPDASSVQADLISSKRAAMGTFASPLSLYKVAPPMVLRTEAPFGHHATDPTAHYHSPPSRRITTAQFTNSSLPAQFTNYSLPDRGNSPQQNTIDQCVNGTTDIRGNASLISPNAQPTSCTEPVRRNAPPNLQSSADYARGNVLNAPMNNTNAQLVFSTEAIRGNAPLNSSNPQPTSCTEPVRRNAPPTPQSCVDYASGNAPIALLHSSSSQRTEPARGTSWAARLGGSRSTSATALSYFPPTLVAGCFFALASSEEPFRSLLHQ